jgi:hypothetical protein
MSDHDIVKTFVNILASQPVTFHDDFQEQPEKTLKKVPVLQVSTTPIDSPHLLSENVWAPSSKSPSLQS